uniref:Sulfatase N-terminal domain-containing protein n=2 Tax=Emiliania huxleyi TaxID=2903 RepID=A0A0D3HXR4_EMIH1
MIIFAIRSLLATPLPGSALSPPPPGAPSSPPLLNLLFFLQDDTGYNDFLTSTDYAGVYSDANALWRQRGILVDRTYADMVCAPSRASFIAGRPSHLVQPKVFSRSQEVTLMQKLSSTGYLSYMVGKLLENPLAYDSVCGHKTNKYNVYYMENTAFENSASSALDPFMRRHYADAEDYYSPTELQEEAFRFLNDHVARYGSAGKTAGVPLFLYFATNAIRDSGDDDSHPSRFYANCTHVANPQRRNGCAASATINLAISELTSYMDTLSSDDWLGIVSSDNGGSAWNFNSPGNNYPLRGNKNEIFEGGVRVQSMIWGTYPPLLSSRMIGHTYSAGFVSIFDWHATFAELGGWTTAGGAEDDHINNGVNYLGDILENRTARPELLFVSGSGSAFLLNGTYKLLEAVPYGPESMNGPNLATKLRGHAWPVRGASTELYFASQIEVASSASYPSNEATCRKQNGKYTVDSCGRLLFDIEADPEESTDLSGSDVELLNQLIDRLQRAKASSAGLVMAPDSDIGPDGTSCASAPSWDIPTCVRATDDSSVYNKQAPVSDLSYADSTTGRPWAECGQYTSHTWGVDLGSEVYVRYVRLQNRNDCCAERLTDVDIYLGSTAE